MCPDCKKEFILYPGYDECFFNMTQQCECNLTLEDMHNRLNHASKNTIVRMKKDGIVKGLDKMELPQKVLQMSYANHV